MVLELVCKYAQNQLMLSTLPMFYLASHPLRFKAKCLKMSWKDQTKVVLFVRVISSLFIQKPDVLSEEISCSEISCDASWQ